MPFALDSKNDICYTKDIKKDREQEEYNAKW